MMLTLFNSQGQTEKRCSTMDVRVLAEDHWGKKHLYVHGHRGDAQQLTLRCAVVRMIILLLTQCQVNFTVLKH